MVDVTVKLVNPVKNTEAPQIVNPYLSSISSAVYAGTVYLDRNGYLKNSLTVTVLYNANAQKGDFVEVLDAIRGVSYIGTVISVSHTVSAMSETTPPDITTAITVEVLR